MEQNGRAAKLSGRLYSTSPESYIFCLLGNIFRPWGGEFFEISFSLFSAGVSFNSFSLRRLLFFSFLSRFLLRFSFLLFSFSLWACFLFFLLVPTSLLGERSLPLSLDEVLLLDLYFLSSLFFFFPLFFAVCCDSEFLNSVFRDFASCPPSLELDSLALSSCLLFLFFFPSMFQKFLFNISVVNFILFNCTSFKTTVNNGVHQDNTQPNSQWIPRTPFWFFWKRLGLVRIWKTWMWKVSKGSWSEKIKSSVKWVSSRNYFCIFSD